MSDLPRREVEAPIVVWGRDPMALLARISTTLVDIAYKGHPGLRFNVVAAQPRPVPHALHPSLDGPWSFSGTDVGMIHPFDTERPPEGFPTLGEYFRGMWQPDEPAPTALSAPTRRDVREYLEFVLDLAVMTVGDKALVSTDPSFVVRVDRGPREHFTVFFGDGRTLEAGHVIEATLPGRLTA